MDLDLLFDPFDATRPDILLGARRAEAAGFSDCGPTTTSPGVLAVAAGLAG